MKTLYVAALLLLSSFLGGCQNMMKTMVAHTTLDNAATSDLAKLNAYTNVCLSDKMMDRQSAYEFSTIAAQFLDLVVFDNGVYKKAYEGNLDAALATSKRGANVNECTSLNRDLPQITTTLRGSYNSIAQRLGRMRAEENRQIAQSLSNFRLATTPIYQPSFPQFEYTQEQSRTQTYLVNTKSGLTQCRVTNNNFVFCL
jgi:hypothetical protein